MISPFGNRALLAALAALAVAVASGCASTRKAYDDRIGWLVNGKPPTIRFGCKTKPVTRLANWEGKSPIPIFVPGVSGVAESGARLAGDLIRWQIGDSAPLAVNVEGPSPEEVLAKDVVDVMAKSGFLLVGGPAAGVLTVTTAVAGIAVDTMPGNLLGTQGETQTAVDFAVKLASGDVSKELSFKGEHAFNVLSAVAKSPEATVNEAYCAGLQGFADAVALPGFVRDARTLLADQAERVASQAPPQP